MSPPSDPNKSTSLAGLLLRVEEEATVDDVVEPLLANLGAASQSSFTFFHY